MSPRRIRVAPPSRSRTLGKTATCLLGLGLLAGGGSPALAEEPAPQKVAQKTDEAPDPDADAALSDQAVPGELSPEELERMLAAGEIILVWGERPDKPFDRDTELRLTGKELAERGATTLAEALELIPELNVREAGRGGRQIDIRGARKGSIKILIDGIAVDDPYYGNFDISSIPVTDIEQIRVSASPASPIDGAGGPGGVVEVHTRDAVGTRMVRAQVQGSSLPAADASATARTHLTRYLAVRTSASATIGAREYVVTMPGASGEIDEGRHAAGGALLLEYRKDHRRVALHSFLQNRAYVVPPGEDEAGDILVIDGETSARVGLVADDQLGRWRVQARAYAHALERESTYYRDLALQDPRRREDLSATRVGIAGLANRPLGKTLHVITSGVIDSEAADVLGFDGTETGGRAGTAELAAGLQYEDGPLAVHGAAGVAAPLGIDAAPWPEFKLSGRYAPVRAMALEATLARKGRVPTLRERFRLDVGNAELGPEQASFGELAVNLAPVELIEVRVAGYVRRTNGLIRYDSLQAALMNEGELDLRGVDARLVVARKRAVSGGASYSFTDAFSAESGLDPLDHLPAHRGDVWVTVKPAARFGGTARASYVGERIDRSMVLPGYAVLDVSAFGYLGAGLFGSVRLDNVLDERYELRVGGVRSAGRVASLLLQGEWD